MSVAEDAGFAGYRIERTLGSGGMGTVYLAQHPRLPRKDAVKVLAEAHADDDGFRARFLREAEVAARLQHPNLVAIHDRGEHAGRLWIAMQYVEDGDLSALIRRGPAVLDVPRVIHILSEAAAGLDEIHRAGLLHRDVKPANILIAERPGGEDRVLVTDFGIARPADDSTTLAGPGGLSATLAYAAPEQISGEPVDQRADVYALGCTLYQMLAGSVPFPRNSAGAVMYAHLHEPPPRPSRHNPRVPAALDAVVATAMAKKPGERFATCSELAAAARAAVTGHGSARRRPVRIGVLAAVLSVVLILGAAVAYGLVTSESGGSPSASRRPITGTIEPTAWGAYAFVPQTFPDLLPPMPFGVGYQELTGCVPLGENWESADLDVVPRVAHLLCLGNMYPALEVDVYCNADRSPIAPKVSYVSVEGDENWTRPSGSGHLFWGTDNFSGVQEARLNKPALGVLDVYFNEPDRNFCRLQVTGTVASGVELRRSWWTEAPL
ncbi:serine/threonine-protein kinase [Nocardia transvalensis]|uniref:non-specific serine/threonine protein kinase n=1 Tax=Nocardia transvalensis TaxID=37333 RepID=A0A7W9PIM2_9NOCA|nr:protein kinase [Nocardia transvalensis]MBB5916585.1 serine/threonine-protein kinase [Nocardia transvalensis]